MIDDHRRNVKMKRFKNLPLLLIVGLINIVFTLLLQSFYFLFIIPIWIFMKLLKYQTQDKLVNSSIRSFFLYLFHSPSFNFLFLLLLFYNLLLPPSFFSVRVFVILCFTLKISKNISYLHLKSNFLKGLCFVACCHTIFYLFSPYKRSCYFVSIQNNCCMFLQLMGLFYNFHLLFITQLSFYSFYTINAMLYRLDMVYFTSIEVLKPSAKTPCIGL